MHGTNDNISLPANQWVNVNELSGITSDKTVVIHNVGSNDIKLCVSLTEPLADSRAYMMLKPRVYPVSPICDSDYPIWAYSANTVGELNVDELSFLPVANTGAGSGSGTNAETSSIFGTPKQTARSSNSDILIDMMKLMLLELRLLNSRIEEAFETTIEIEDTIDGYDSRG